MIGTGGAACSGWPANAPHGKLTALFTPVAVERCVSSVQQIKGKGEWQTATLERSTDKLATLTAVLMRAVRAAAGRHVPRVRRHPAADRALQLDRPGAHPPASGRRLRQRRLAGAGTLATMTWQPLSVRLVSKVEPVVSPKTFPGASLSPGSPKVLRTGAATGVVNG